MANNNEIERRRTFAIIAHPDAGKTSLTEKLLLFGGQIQVAGAVKSNKIKKTATSDWMDIEKQRGISVTTSVMEFDYHDYKVNILDTPGHQDFAEDTYRTLTAVDSVIIVVDGAKGVETQTRKLMEVCRMRNTPVIIFINKMDREAKDPFDLLDELEEELHIHVRPLTWPIESGVRFKGVYNIYEHNLNLYQPSKQVVTEKVEVDIHTEELDNRIGAQLADKLRGELELIDGVYPEFDKEEYLKGELAPVFFGSALNNFGVQELLDCFVEIAPSPRPVKADVREVEPEDEDRYQNIFAAEEGAVVAPAAGLHFSRELMKRLEIKDCQFAFLTLHSGLGNFREIDVEDLTKHKMDSEQMVVNADVVDIVNKGKDEGHKVCAVGTSVMRAIETAVSTDGHLKEFDGWTNKFIFPPYDFSVANSMVTNFHLPLSTLLMLVAAYGGYDLVMEAYHTALKEDYRFGTYGDAMLILDK